MLKKRGVSFSGTNVSGRSLRKTRSRPAVAATSFSPSRSTSPVSSNCSRRRSTTLTLPLTRNRPMLSKPIPYRDDQKVRRVTLWWPCSRFKINSLPHSKITSGFFGRILKVRYYHSRLIHVNC